MRPSRIGSIDRRTFVQRAGAAGLTVAAGLGGILAARRAPARARPTTIHLLQWIDFIPEADVELERQLAAYTRQTGTGVRLERVDANLLPARIVRAIEARRGPDVVLMLHNWPHLYRDSLADLEDLCEWKARGQDGYYPAAAAAARAGSRWLALPYGVVPLLIAYRRSWFADVGASEPPQTLDEYRQIGARLKRRGRPLGQALSHTFGDAPAWTYPILWAFGGAELDASGGRVVLDSRATLESVKWMTAFWSEACDETGVRWDDSDNNRAFHRGKIGATLNGASIYVVAKRSAAPDRAPIYFAAKRRPEWIRDERGAPMFEDIDPFPIPAGVVPTPGYPAVFSHAVLGYSPNRQAARELLRWLHGREQFGRWLRAAGGYNVGATRIWERDPLWERIDPPLRPFRTAARASRMFGYAGPPNALAGDVYAKYIVTDMYARAVQGVPPADAVRWAARQLAQSYGR